MSIPTFSSALYKTMIFRFKGKKKIISYDISSKKRIILVSLKKYITNSDVENLGASFYDKFKNNKINEFNLNSDTLSTQQKFSFIHKISGSKLKFRITKKFIYSLSIFSFILIFGFFIFFISSSKKSVSNTFSTIEKEL